MCARGGGELEITKSADRDEEARQVRTETFSVLDMVARASPFET